MIIGIGSDLIDIRRIEKTLEKHGDRFTQRVFTEIEQAKSDGRNSVQPLMQSVSLQRKPVQRLLVPGFRMVCSGGTWVSSIRLRASQR